METSFPMELKTGFHGNKLSYVKIETGFPTQKWKHAFLRKMKTGFPMEMETSIPMKKGNIYGN